MLIQSIKNKEIRCPQCLCDLKIEEKVITCAACGESYPFWNGIPLTAKDTNFYYNQIDKIEMERFLDESKKIGIQNAVDKCLAEAKYESFLLNTFDSRRDFFKILLEVDCKKTVLDLGCGNGALSSGLCSIYGRVFSMDLTKERCWLTKLRADEGSRENNVVLSGGDRKFLPFEDKMFDCVILNGVLEWVAESQPGNPNSIQKNFLVEINRILKDDGLVYIGIENRSSLSYLWRNEDHTGLRFGSFLPRCLANIYSMLIRKKPYRTYTYTWFGYKKLLKRSGFNKVRIFCPTGMYRAIMGFLDPDNLLWKKYYNRKLWHQYVIHNLSRRRILCTIKGLAKYTRDTILPKIFHPSFSIIAKKNTEIDLWVENFLKEKSIELCGENSYQILDISAGKTPVCIIKAIFGVNKGVIIKIPYSGNIKKRLENEANALENIQSFSKTSQISNQIPTSLDSGSYRNIDYFIQTWVSGDPFRRDANMDNKQNRAVLSFLFNLSETVNPLISQKSSTKFLLEELGRVKSGVSEHYYLSLQLLILQSSKILETNNKSVPMHGDFHLGNLLWRQKSLSGVIDWDSFQMAGIPFYDLFHFIFNRSSKEYSNLEQHYEVIASYPAKTGVIDEGCEMLVMDYCKKVFGKYDKKIITEHVFVYLTYLLVRKIQAIYISDFRHKNINKLGTAIKNDLGILQDFSKEIGGDEDN